jgi:hypothetical protein
LLAIAVIAFAVLVNSSVKALTQMECEDRLRVAAYLTRQNTRLTQCRPSLKAFSALAFTDR